jgi:predicted MFS family arabinose efflux permease
LSEDRVAAKHDTRTMLLGSLLYVAGSTIFYMMPPYLAFLGGRLSLDAGQLGTLAAIESLAIAITSLLGPFWIGRIDRRICIVVGLVACVAGNIATGFAGSFDMLLVARFLVGLLGEGLIYTTSFAILGAVRNIDRAFAIALTAAVVYGAAVTVVSGMLEHVFPAIGPISALVGIALVVFPFLGWLTPSEKAQPDAVAAPVGAPGGWNWVGILGLLAQAVWFGAPGAFWTFVEQVATDKGVPGGTAEMAVSFGELTGLLGCVVAALLGNRLGRLKPIVVATAGMIMPAIVYQSSDGAVALAAFLAIFYGFWNYGTVYQMSFVTELDASGRTAVAMPAAQVFGLSFGPYVAGRLILDHGDGAVTASTIVFALTGLGLYFICFARLRRAAFA